MRLYIRMKNCNESGKPYQVADCATSLVVAEFDNVGEAQEYIISKVVKGE